MPDQLIIDHLDSAILGLDSNGNILQINSACETLFDLSSKFLVGKPIESLFSQVEQNSFTENWSSTKINPAYFSEHSATLTRVDGLAFSADVAIRPVSDSHSDIGFVVEIRALNRQIEIAQEELNNIQLKSSQKLTRGLAHEIRNPLGGIRGAAQLLEREIENNSIREYTEIIIREVDRLQTLIENMLGPTAGIKKQSVNILEVFEHIRTLILAGSSSKITLARDYDPSIPEIQGDKNLLIQAFLNIALNAVQAIEEAGEIIFKTRIDRNITFDKQLHPLVLKADIIDSGNGVSSELGDSIFMPMVTDKTEGTGLGLSIAQDIIDRHEGMIRYINSEKGTTFSIYLPLQL